MRYFVFFFLIIWLAGCSTKHKAHTSTHKAHKEYILPQKNNNTCLNTCEANKKKCEAISKEEYENCLEEAKGEADLIYDEEKKQYDKEYTNDGAKVIKKYKKSKLTFELEDDDYDLNKPNVSNEYEPKRDDVLYDKQKECLVEHFKYHCQQDYDSCFRKCGGKIIFK